MEQTYTGMGVQFHYPADWELTEELGEWEASVTVRSLQTAFWSVTVLRKRPQALEVLRAVIRGYEEEYDELDIIESEIEVAMLQAQAIEIDFVCLELTNTAWICAFETARSTVLVVSQLNDGELEIHEELLKGITDSLIVDTDFESRR